MARKNEAEKRFLGRYRWGMERLEEIEQEIASYRVKALPGAISYDGMPHGSGDIRDLSDYAVKLDRILSRQRRIREETLKARREIEAAIDVVGDSKCRTLLRLRHIALLRWREIADQMGYSEIYVRTNLYEKALAEIRLL